MWPKYGFKINTENIIHRTNETALKRARAMKLLCMNKRQANFFEHLMKRKGLKHLAITGKINGKRSNGCSEEIF